MFVTAISTPSCKFTVRIKRECAYETPSFRWTQTKDYSSFVIEFWNAPPQVVNHGVPLKLLERTREFCKKNSWSRWKRSWLIFGPKRIWCRAMAYAMATGCKNGKTFSFTKMLHCLAATLIFRLWWARLLQVQYFFATNPCRIFIVLSHLQISSVFVCPRLQQVVLCVLSWQTQSVAL